MRIAIVSDIHGNRTAFEAVLADLRHTSPDLVLHGGDLADPGSGPADIVDRIRDLGWPGVVGNADEMLFAPETLVDFAKQSGVMQSVLPIIEEMAAHTRAALGDERIAWLRALPRMHAHGPVALVHASPASTWRSPGPDASDAELELVYGPLGQPFAVYGHVHVPFIRRMPSMTVNNTGSVSLSYDGDRRAAYLLLDSVLDGTLDGVLDEFQPSIRRVEYDVDRELTALYRSGMPHADWIAKMLTSARPQMP